MPKLHAHIFAVEPAALTLDKNKTYHWCSCGLSKSQPFCDGSHQGGDHQPLAFTVKNNYTQWLCNCKQTKRPPFCDGSHNKIPVSKA